MLSLSRAKTHDDIAGLEHDWLACDGEGFVALFSTAGAGAVPAAFLEDIESFDTAIAALLKLPGTSTPRCTQKLAPGLIDTWKLVAERGVFAFDSEPLGAPYQRVATPMNAAHITALPARVSVAARQVVLVDVLFRETSRLEKHPLLRKAAVGL